MKKSDNLVLTYDPYDANLLTHCCGILEVGDLGFGELLEDPDEQEFQLCPETLLKKHKVGLILATTITSTKKTNEALSRLGFKELERAKNPSTGNTVILWCYKKTPVVRKRATKC